MYIVQVGQRKWTIPEKNGLASIKYCLDCRCLLCNSLFLHLINGKLCCICGYVIYQIEGYHSLYVFQTVISNSAWKKWGIFVLVCAICCWLRQVFLVAANLPILLQFSPSPRGIITTSILCLVLLLAAVVPFVRSYPCTCRGSSGKPLLILVFCGCMYG